jgi:intracellular sulfur oxidation DsrE/DsrF family protein
MKTLRFLVLAAAWGWLLGMAGMRQGQAQEQPAPAPGAKVFPRIRSAGGVVPLPHAALQPRPGLKVIFDITADAAPAEVNKGLERAARLLNLYASAGMKGAEVKVVLVLHGAATRSVLTDAAYRARFQTANNPNLPVLQELAQSGVAIYVCGQALAQQQIPSPEVAPPVTVALSALTAVLNHQADGYLCVSVP